MGAERNKNRIRQEMGGAGGRETGDYLEPRREKSKGGGG